MGCRKSLLEQRTLVSDYPTAELKTIQIPPPWCCEGIRMFTALEVHWMVLFQWVR
jgi:hypothetical protein